ncbi:MAG: LacI family DNA-binding transcriptional regulator [Balneolaceae bacterium]|nr:LacI family DNA-binding transcriptional regulator [Balneolaceae bacterium]MCH8547428.1 LacI family transcriptional regulator [Balneolaceae bacterium]
MVDKVTLKDIAEDTGLSISTVSRALSRSGKISRENEKKVFESAYRLDYPLSNMYTPIELRKNLNIAMITRHYTGEFYASLFEGFDQATKDTKATMHLTSVTHSSSPIPQIVSELKKANYDAGVIFLPDFKATDYLELLKSVSPNFPLVSIAPIANPVMDTVTFDNYRGGHLVASHFEERGYRKLGIIQGPVKQSEAMLRKSGYADYIEASDNMDLIWQFNGDYSFQNGKVAYEDFKQLADKPDAIFCSNDGMTLGFMHSAIRDGVHIPEDVAVVGFDDLPTCELYTPTITSVHTPYTMLGKKTLELIFTRLKEKTDSPHTGYTSLVPVSLSVRESSTELNNVFRDYYPNHA